MIWNLIEFFSRMKKKLYFGTPLLVFPVLGLNFFLSMTAVKVTVSNLDGSGFSRVVAFAPFYER